MVRRFGRTALLALGVACMAPGAFGGPAIAPGSTPPGAPGDHGISALTDMNLGFSQDLLFSPAFVSPVQQLFSAPTDSAASVDAAALPSYLGYTDTTLQSVLIQPGTVDPMISPMASVLATLPDPGHLNVSPAGLGQRASPTFYCLSQAQLNARQYRYWSFLMLTEPGAAAPPAFEAGRGPDAQAANDPADTNDEWCGANTPTPWASEPFTMNLWAPVVVLSLGIFLFWAARGFRTP